MAKEYAILQKKLEELESELDNLFCDSVEATLPYQQLLTEAIERRFLFLKNLLAAEMESGPGNPRHLQHMASRMELLERAFLDWAARRKAPEPGFDCLSDCSCTRSCLNQEDETLLEPGSPEERTAGVEESGSEQKWEEGLRPQSAVAAEGGEERRRGWMGRRRTAAAAVVVAIAVGAVTAKLWLCCCYQEGLELLPPT